IGMTLAVAFGFFCRQFGVSTPAWWVSIAFGAATTLLPSLWMFPALGFGVFGLNGPAELLLLSHGLGQSRALRRRASARRTLCRFALLLTGDKVSSLCPGAGR